MRVLVITPWFPNRPGDQSGNFILHSVESLLRSGNEVTVLVTRPWTPKLFASLHPDWNRPPLQASLFDPALNIHVCHFLSIPRNYCRWLSEKLFSLATKSTIRRLIARYGIEVIHAHTENLAPVVQEISNECALPSVLTLHGINKAPRVLDTPAKRRRLQLALNAISRIVLVGEPLREYFDAIATADRNFMIVPNGFYLPPILNRQRGILQDKEIRIISISNLHEGKGIELTLQALHLLSERGLEEWTYTVVGGGAEARALQSLVLDLGLEGRVRFRGALPHYEALEALDNADIFLLPSYREAFGVAYLEAMASGLLTIGVQGQGPEAFIRHGETGYLLPPRDIEAIAELLYSISLDKTGAAKIAALGKAYVQNNFTWDRHAEKLERVYAEAIKELS